MALSDFQGSGREITEAKTETDMRMRGARECEVFFFP